MYSMFNHKCRGIGGCSFSVLLITNRIVFFSLYVILLLKCQFNFNFLSVSSVTIDSVREKDRDRNGCNKAMRIYGLNPWAAHSSHIQKKKHISCSNWLTLHKCDVSRFSFMEHELSLFITLKITQMNWQAENCVHFLWRKQASDVEKTTLLKKSFRFHRRKKE